MSDCVWTWTATNSPNASSRTSHRGDAGRTHHRVLLAKGLNITTQEQEPVETTVARLGAYNAAAPVALSLADPDEFGPAQGQDGTLLRGSPGLVKDDIAVNGFPLTCGSTALRDWYPRRDAAAVRALRAAGGRVIGKANLSEWAGGRSHLQVRGWSSMGGQLGHPRDARYSPGGSSSGSAVAVAEGLVDWALGSELVGSVVGPASINGTFGLKPTLGTISSDGLMPINGGPSQSTIGILARSPRVLRTLFHVLTGRPGTVPRQPAPMPQEVVLVAAGPSDTSDQWDLLADDLQARLRRRGTHVEMPPEYRKPGELLRRMQELLSRESGWHYSRFLGALPDEYPQSLEELISYNNRHRTGELGFDDQRWFEEAVEAPSITPETLQDHIADRGKLQSAMAAEIERLMGGAGLLLGFTERPAWLLDPASGDPEPSWLPALACASGYPHITLPGLTVDSWPVGVSIIGRPNSDHNLVSVAEALHDLLAGSR